MRRCQFGHRDRGDLTQPKLLEAAGTPRTSGKAGELTAEPGNGNLKLVLERGDGARSMGKCGDKMAQSHGVGMTVSFTRRRRNQPQPRADMTGEITPSGEPAADGAK